MHAFLDFVVKPPTRLALVQRLLVAMQAKDAKLRHFCGVLIEHASLFYTQQQQPGFALEEAWRIAIVEKRIAVALLLTYHPTFNEKARRILAPLLPHHMRCLVLYEQQGAAKAWVGNWPLPLLPTHRPRGNGASTQAAKRQT